MLAKDAERGQRIYKREEKRGRFGAHEKNMSQRPVGFENTQMTAQIGPLPDGVLVLFITPRVRRRIMF